MRLFISIRTHFAEQCVAAAHFSGVRQLLVLGAGLDLHGSRRSLPEGLRVFEVDRRRVERLPSPKPPGSVTYVAVDFENPDCAERLAAAGFDRGQRTLVTCLGVVPYLTEDAFWSTLRFMARLPGGAELVFDYSNPPHTLSPERHRFDEQLTTPAVVSEEQALSYFETADLHERLHDLGFVHVQDLGPVEIAQRYLPNVNAHVAGTGGHIVRIATA